MTDLEYEIAMMAARQFLGDGPYPIVDIDDPESWKVTLGLLFLIARRWFDEAITQYLKGR
jgi:hypothetical protein